MEPREDDRTARAVDELNRRLARAQRRMVRATTVLAVAAGLACAVWTLQSLHFEPIAARAMIPAFLAAAVATLGLGGLLVRGLLGQLKGVWARQIAEKEGASADEVVSFALPFGGPPGREGKSRAWRQAGIATGITAAAVIMIGLFVDWETALRVAAVITTAMGTMAFYSYLGFRAPR